MSEIKKSADNDKTMSIVAYLGIIGIVVVLVTGAHQKSESFYRTSFHRRHLGKLGYKV